MEGAKLFMDIIISNSSNEPIYEQIVKQIKNLIIRGIIKEGEPLPSIRNLAKELQISVITTKRAYEELENDGFIDKVAGKGSFVAPQNKNLLKERGLKIVEQKLTAAITAARSIDLTLKDMQEILKILYEEV